MAGNIYSRSAKKILHQDVRRDIDPAFKSAEAEIDSIKATISGGLDDSNLSLNPAVGNSTLANVILSNVKHYGAKGNGVTDDTVAIQAAINAVPQAGGRVFFPIGNYKVTASLLINVANKPIELFGAGVGEQIHGAPAGGGSVLIWAGAVAVPLLSISNNATSVTVKDLSFDNTNAGGTLATHGILAIDSGQLRIVNVLMFPAAGLGFTTAGLELGSSGHPVLKAHVEDCYFRGNTVGTLITSVIVALLTRCVHIDNTTCSIAGTTIATAYVVDYVGCTFEARIGQTGARVVRGNSVSYYGCQFDAWDNTHFGFEILSSASLVSSVSFFGGRFTGNTVPAGLKVDFAYATVQVNGVFFSGFTTSGIKNANNKYLSIIGCHSDDAASPIVDSTLIGYVTMLSNDNNGLVTADKIGIASGVIYARGMVSANVPDLTQFTCSGAGRDGLTYAIGDVAVLNNQTILAQNGPYMVGKVTANVAALTRPPSWQTGAAIPSGAEFHLANDGTDYGGLTLLATVASGGVVDTNDPVLLFKEIMCHVSAAGAYTRTKGFASTTAITKPGGAGGYSLTTAPVGVDLTKMVYAFQALNSAQTTNVSTITITATTFRYLFAVGLTATDEEHTLHCRLIP